LAPNTCTYSRRLKLYASGRSSRQVTLPDGHEFYMFLFGLVAHELWSRRNDLIVSSTTRSLQYLTVDMFASAKRLTAVRHLSPCLVKVLCFGLRPDLYPTHPSEGESYKICRSSHCGAWVSNMSERHVLLVSTELPLGKQASSWYPT